MVFVGTDSNVDEIDELGTPKSDGEILAPNRGAEVVPKIGWEDVVLDGFVENEKLELNTEGDDPNIGELDVY